MKLTCLGAAGTVTGSCFLLEAAGKKILIDNGMFRGHEEEKLNYEEERINPADIDAVLLTHGHVDHCGKIPKLKKDGFNGKVICTKATREIAESILVDSAGIMNFEVWSEKEKAWIPNPDALYTVDEAIESINSFESHEYHEEIKISNDITIKLINSGHMLGSAAFVIDVNEDGENKTVVCTGDLGNKENKLLCNPEIVEKANYLIIESTYGDRNHNYKVPIKDQLMEGYKHILNSPDNGNMLISTLAFGRMQDIILEISELMDENKEIQGIPVYIDSKLGMKAYSIYQKNLDALNPESVERFKKSINKSNIIPVATTKASKELSSKEEKSVIIATSGMMEGGRILNHILNTLSNESSYLFFSNYLPVKTQGREIYESSLLEENNIKCKVKKLEGTSSHMDQAGLVEFVSGIKELEKVFIVHGDPDATKGLQNAFKEVLEENIEIIIAKRNATYGLNEDYYEEIIYSNEESEQEKVFNHSAIIVSSDNTPLNIDDEKKERYFEAKGRKIQKINIENKDAVMYYKATKLLEERFNDPDVMSQLDEEELELFLDNLYLEECLDKKYNVTEKSEEMYQKHGDYWGKLELIYSKLGLPLYEEMQEKSENSIEAEKPIEAEREKEKTYINIANEDAVKYYKAAMILGESFYDPEIMSQLSNKEFKLFLDYLYLAECRENNYNPEIKETKMLRRYGPDFMEKLEDIELKLGVDADIKIDAEFEVV